MSDKPDLLRTLNCLSRASSEIGRTIARLEDQLDDDVLSESEKTRVRVALPSLRARRIEIDADVVAYSAKARTLAPPSLEMICDIERATAALAARAAQAREADVVLSLLHDLVKLVGGVGGAVR